MPIFLSHISALRAYRAGVVPTLSESGQASRVQLHPACPSIESTHLIERFCIFSSSDKIHVLVPAAQWRSKRRLFVSHVWSNPVPTGAFFKLSKDIYVSTPPFLFLQMAQGLSRIQLTALAYELCALYHLRNHNEGPSLSGNFDQSSPTHQRPGFAQISQPLTNTATIARFLDRTIGAKSIKNAQWAIRHAGDNAASPMETLLAMILTLPTSVGGFGLPKPVLNYRITVSRQRGDYKFASFRECDLYWPKYRLDVEYDSDAEHTGPERISSDATRRNQIIDSGKTVITITKDHFFNFPAFDEQVRYIEKILGHQRTKKVSNLENRQRALHRLLIDKDFEVR